MLHPATSCDATPRVLANFHVCGGLKGLTKLFRIETELLLF